MKKAVKKSLNVLVIGFGCCKPEIYSTRSPLYDIERLGINFVSLPEDADLLVVQGFLNPQGAARVLDCYQRMNNPKWVAFLGTCVLDRNMLSSGNQTLEELKKELPADIFIPGCPPRPEAFIYAILKLLDKEDM
ncbi:MAG: hypothetical protein ACQEP5_03855 [Actinomycetota bacterium]